jgi:arabinose-5-phosphate isomerase
MGMAVVMEGDRVAGVITDGDVRRTMQARREEFFDVTVGEVMTRQPKSVSPDTKLPVVQRILQDNNIHAVPVVDAEHHLLGIVDSLSCLL